MKERNIKVRTNIILIIIVAGIIGGIAQGASTAVEATSTILVVD